ncbi:MAG: Mth938-like domain-containing protein [Alphaproteobacteria bacterium]
MASASAAPATKRWIEGYGGGRFRITGEVHEGSVIVFTDRVERWSARDLDGIDAPKLAARLAASGAVDLLLLGCGPRGTVQAPPSLVTACREVSIAVEAMDTGAACRTWNVLAAEDRRVAAALIAID